MARCLKQMRHARHLSSAAYPFVSSVPTPTAGMLPCSMSGAAAMGPRERAFHTSARVGLDSMGAGPAVDDGASDTASFGFKKVEKDKKQGMVAEVFHNVASDYDIMNDAMSVGIHRLWKKQFMEELAPDRSTRLLDVAGGTGDIAFKFLDKAKSTQRGIRQLDGEDNAGPHVTICDINASMLEQGKLRAESMGIASKECTWVEGSAEELPFDDNSFEAYTISFGIRNVTNIDKALEEAHRVLVPGGRFLCLEFSQVVNPLLRTAYDKYSFEVIPAMGHLIANDWDSYQYLVESIRMFPTQDKFASMIESAGFSHVTYENMTGGVVAMHSGFKL